MGNPRAVHGNKLSLLGEWKELRARDTLLSRPFHRCGIPTETAASQHVDLSFFLLTVYNSFYHHCSLYSVSVSSISVFSDAARDGDDSLRSISLRSIKCWSNMVRCELGSWFRIAIRRTNAQDRCKPQPNSIIECAKAPS